MKKRIMLTVAACLIAPSLSFAKGAIAVDDEEGISSKDVGYYVSIGEDSEAAAKKAAMVGCKKIGSKNCEVVGWFNTCGAYVVSKKYSGFGNGKTQEIAIANAMKECNDKNCRLVVAECE